MPRHGPHPDDLDERDVPPVGFTRETLRDAWQLAGYLKPYLGRFLLSLVGLAVGSSLSLALPYVAGLLVDSAIAGQANSTCTPWPRSHDPNQPLRP